MWVLASFLSPLINISRVIPKVRLRYKISRTTKGIAKSQNFLPAKVYTLVDSEYQDFTGFWLNWRKNLPIYPVNFNRSLITIHIATSGFPQYEQCFVSNHISGRKLITIDASNLPRIGVTDYTHIRTISQKIKELLGIETQVWERSISLPPRDPVSHFLERKSHTGQESDALTFQEHVRYLKKYNEHGCEWFLKSGGGAGIWFENIAIVLVFVVFIEVPL